MVDNYGQLMNYLFYLFSKVCRSMIWYKGSLAGMVDHYSQLMNYLFYLFSKVWRSIIWYEGSLAGMVDHYGQLMNFNKNYTWEVDQNIVS